MTVALDYMARLEAHMAAATAAKGKVIAKGMLFYDVDLEVESTREDMLTILRGHGFKAQFVKYGGYWSLRVCKRKDGCEPK